MLSVVGEKKKGPKASSIWGKFLGWGVVNFYLKALTTKIASDLFALVFVATESDSAPVVVTALHNLTGVLMIFSSGFLKPEDHIVKLVVIVVVEDDLPCSGGFAELFGPFFEFRI